MFWLTALGKLVMTHRVWLLVSVGLKLGAVQFGDKNLHGRM